MDHFGPFWPKEVHFGPFRSANRTLGIPELPSDKNDCESAIQKNPRVRGLGFFLGGGGAPILFLWARGFF